MRHPPGKAPVEHQALRDDFIRKQLALEAASVELRAVLLQVEKATRNGRRHLAKGGWAVDVPAVADVADVRLALAEQMELLDRARMASRIANMRLAVAEGASISDIAKEYRLSRQFVSKALRTDDD